MLDAVEARELQRPGMGPDRVMEQERRRRIPRKCKGVRDRDPEGLIARRAGRWRHRSIRFHAQRPSRLRAAKRDQRANGAAMSKVAAQLPIFPASRRFLRGRLP
jgi:hypothetical protein